MRWLPWAFLLFLSPAFPAEVVVLSIGGPVGPATADYVHRGLDRAGRDGAPLVVLRLDTPGGLDTSMRAIIKDILASPVPVAAFVAPGGARAASAGTFILYACHVAAMAPGTNLGAASPVPLGGGPGAEPATPKSPDGKGAEPELPLSGTMGRKQMHDAAAYIRGLAQLRGRNADWAERAVREAVSLSADEALAAHVIDLVAADLPDLLAKVDGRKVAAGGVERTLATQGAAPKALDPDWRTEFLSVITDPTIAYVLLLLGLYAVVFELTNPGLVLPGVAGVVALLVALYGLQMLPVNYAGLALILVGVGLMVTEVFLPAYGSLGVGGLVAFVIGSVILIDTQVAGYGIPLGLVAGFAVASAAFLLLVAGVLVRSRRRPVVSGREELIGAEGAVLDDFEGEGWARVHGETWRVRSAAPLKGGERVRVVSMAGLTLEVEPEPRKGG